MKRLLSLLLSLLYTLATFTMNTNGHILLTPSFTPDQETPKSLIAKQGLYTSFTVAIDIAEYSVYTNEQVIKQDIKQLSTDIKLFIQQLDPHQEIPEALLEKQKLLVQKKKIKLAIREHKTCMKEIERSIVEIDRATCAHTLLMMNLEPQLSNHILSADDQRIVYDDLPQEVQQGLTETTFLQRDIEDKERKLKSLHEKEKRLATKIRNLQS